MHMLGQKTHYKNNSSGSIEDNLCAGLKSSKNISEKTAASKMFMTNKLMWTFCSLGFSPISLRMEHNVTFTPLNWTQPTEESPTSEITPQTNQWELTRQIAVILGLISSVIGILLCIWCLFKKLRLACLWCKEHFLEGQSGKSKASSIPSFQTAVDYQGNIDVLTIRSNSSSLESFHTAVNSLGY